MAAELHSSMLLLFSLSFFSLAAAMPCTHTSDAHHQITHRIDRACSGGGRTLQLVCIAHTQIHWHAGSTGSAPKAARVNRGRWHVAFSASSTVALVLWRFLGHNDVYCWIVRGDNVIQNAIIIELLTVVQ